MAAFQQFALALFDPDETPIFADRVLYVPGNHDHRHWQMMRDELDLDSLRRTPGHEMPAPVVITPMFPDRFAECDVVTTLVRRATGNQQLVVESGYPNIGFRAGDKWVVLHHGHYAEGTYRAISTLLAAAEGGSPTLDAEGIEFLNGPWIDFLWSSFGGQGPLGGKVFNLYETMQDAAASHTAVKSLTEVLLTKISAKMPVRGDAPITTHGITVTVRGMIEGLLDMSLARFAQSERSSVDAVLSPDGVEGVRWYLQHPVRQQLLDTEFRDAPTPDVSFVFGHTHKPFQDQVIVPGYPLPVKLWNTGGWVLDQPSLSPSQGAAVIVVDDDANVASIRLFNNPVPDVAAVHVAGCAGVDPSTNPLVGQLASAVQRADSWQRFTALVAPELEKRSKFVRRMFFDPDADPIPPGRRSDAPPSATAFDIAAEQRGGS
jgi:hypothetical protein